MCLRLLASLSCCLLACSGPAATGDNRVSPLEVEPGPPEQPPPEVLAAATAPAPSPPPLDCDGARAPIPQPADDVWNHIPYQRYPAVAGAVVGLLYEINHASWGVGLDHMRLPTRHKSYVFSTDGSSPYVLYFPSNGKGDNFLRTFSVPTGDGSPLQLSAARFSATTRNAYGLQRPAHLVELEVNHGRGGRGIHFVATSARVLDGSPGYTLDAQAQLARLRERYRQTFAGVQAEFSHMFADRRDRLLFAARCDRPAYANVRTGLSYNGVWPSWHDDTQQLHVTFAHAQGAAIHVMMPPPPANCPPGTACRQPMGEIRNTPFRVTFGVTYVVASDGEVIAETVHPVAVRDLDLRNPHID